MKTSLLILFSILSLNSSRAAVAVVDVNSPWGGTKDAYSSYGQTFTPGLDGTLVGLRLYVTSSSPFVVTIWNFDSTTGELGTNLGSQSYVSSEIFTGGYGWAEVAIQTHIQQIGGKPLAFTVTSSPGFGPAISDQSVYSGGAFFEYPGSAAVTLTNRDLTFQTLVVAVPEPDLSLLAGSTTILWGISRRRGRRMGQRQ